MSLSSASATSSRQSYSFCLKFNEDAIGKEELRDSFRDDAEIFVFLRMA
jgi:hypothetical protein